MSKHTPGRWHAVEFGIESNRPMNLQSGSIVRAASLLEVRANAMAAAAAPNLLDALEAILRIPGLAAHPEYYDAVAAIARAKGESQ